jgi:translation initiation factor IF-2
MKERIFKIAKDIGIDSKILISKLKEIGLDVKSHLDYIDIEILPNVKKYFDTPQAGEIVVSHIAPTVKRRRRQSETEPEPAPMLKPVVEEVKPAEIPVEKKVSAAEKKAVEEPSVPEPALEQKAQIIDLHAAEERKATNEKLAEEKVRDPGQTQVLLQAGKPAAEMTEEAASKKDSQWKSLADEAPAKAKKKRLIYDRRRNVISLRDFEEELTDVEVKVVPKKKKPQKGKKSLKPMITLPRPQKRIIRMEDAITVAELAKSMGVKSGDVIMKLMNLGVTATINQSIDYETAYLVAQDFSYTVEKVGFDLSKYIKVVQDSETDLVPRPPVVTIMGHVDHGKTTLLDRIRQSHIAEKEAGGITQHIGAYLVNLKKGRIAFLDTPGHEAFTAMRARGTKVTDIVVLVVAADDGVQNQTIEAINHAREADVPIIVAVNKIDKPEANVEFAKSALSEYNLVSEEWGGQTIFCEISAKNNIGIDHLLDMILLQADMLELKANPDKPAKGVVVETRLDPHKGPLATVIVQEGTLNLGQSILCGSCFGKVRQMFDDTGKSVKTAPPSTPVEIMGFNVLPNASEIFNVLEDEKKTKAVVEWKLGQEKAQKLKTVKRVSLEDLFSQVKSGELKELKAILKCDMQGTVEALTTSLQKIEHPEIKLRIIHSGVGKINESDVNLAIASNAIIIGFDIKIDPAAEALANCEKVDVKLYSIIYEALEDIEKAMKGMLAPKTEEVCAGKAEVRQIFSIGKVGVIAGSLVIEGRIVKGARAKLKRGDEIVYEGTVSSLKRFKDDVREVKTGLECGIGLEKFDEILANDIIEIYETREVK